jgi:hypothetical protein
MMVKKFQLCRQFHKFMAKCDIICLGIRSRIRIKMLDINNAMLWIRRIGFNSDPDPAFKGRWKRETMGAGNEANIR